jgi:HlyD family secretion protein
LGLRHMPAASPASLLSRLRNRRGTIAALATAAIAILIYFLASARPLAVQVAVPEKDVTVRVFGLGSVEAQVLARVGFEVGATIAEVKADHGDTVRKGDELARLVTGEQEARVAKARAARLLADSNIKRAEANLEKASAVLAQKIEANRRKQTLAGRSVVSEQTAEEAVRDEAVAKADVAVARSEGETAKAQLADADAQLTFEETLLRHRTLVAPFDAVVIERHKEPGSVVKAGDPVFTLIAANSYWGLAFVDEARAGFIEEGQRVDARLRSRPLEAFVGKVLRIGLESDRTTEERKVYVRGDSPPSRIYLGEQAEFWITVAKLPNALLVPEAAVNGFDGRQGRVWTIEDGRLQRRAVSFRHRTEDARLEVAGDLPANAQVVTGLVAGMTEGRRARPIEARP